MLPSNIYLPFFVNDFLFDKKHRLSKFFSAFSKSCIIKNILSAILILLFVMGLMSFALGTCVGFYFRNTGLGIELSKRILAVSKLLKDKSIPDYKLVLIVRDDLNMSKGKIASQCSHASVLAYKNASLSDFETAYLWEIFGQSKIVLKAPNESKLIELSNQARELRLLTNIVCDAGRTEVNAGTKTVLAIGPGPKATIDKVTAQLKLL